MGTEGVKMASVGLYEMWLIRSNFIKTTYDISLDSQISFLPLGFSPSTQPSVDTVINWLKERIPDLRSER